jgi:hypothetical protein
MMNLGLVVLDDGWARKVRLTLSPSIWAKTREFGMMTFFPVWA